MDDVRNNDMDDKEFPFGFRRLPVSDRLLEEHWKAVEDAIRQQEHAPLTRGAGVYRLPRAIGRLVAVAACLGALVFGIWWIGARTGRLQYSLIKTGYGE